MSVTPLPVLPRVVIALAVLCLASYVRAIPVQEANQRAPDTRTKIDELLSQSGAASKEGDLKGALRAAGAACRMAEGALPADDSLRTRATAELVRLQVLDFVTK